MKFIGSIRALQRQEHQEQRGVTECDSECGHDLAIWRGESRVRSLAGICDIDGADLEVFEKTRSRTTQPAPINDR